MLRLLNLIETIALLWLIHGVVPLAYRETPEPIQETVTDDIWIHRSVNWKNNADDKIYHRDTAKETVDPKSSLKATTPIPSPDKAKRAKFVYVQKNNVKNVQKKEKDDDKVKAEQKKIENTKENDDNKKKRDKNKQTEAHQAVNNTKHSEIKHENTIRNPKKNDPTKPNNKSSAKPKQSWFTYLTQHSFHDDIYNQERFKRQHPPMLPVLKEKFLQNSYDEELFKMFEDKRRSPEESDEYSSESSSDSYDSDDSDEWFESISLSFDVDFVWSSDYVKALTRMKKSNSKTLNLDVPLDFEPDYNYQLLSFGEESESLLLDDDIYEHGNGKENGTTDLKRTKMNRHEIQEKIKGDIKPELNMELNMHGVKGERHRNSVIDFNTTIKHGVHEKEGRQTKPVVINNKVQSTSFQKKDKRHQTLLDGNKVYANGVQEKASNKSGDYNPNLKNGHVKVNGNKKSGFDNLNERNVLGEKKQHKFDINNNKFNMHGVQQKVNVQNKPILESKVHVTGVQRNKKSQEKYVIVKNKETVLVGEKMRNDRKKPVLNDKKYNKLNHSKPIVHKVQERNEELSQTVLVDNKGTANVIQQKKEQLELLNVKNHDFKKLEKSRNPSLIKSNVNVAGIQERQHKPGGINNTPIEGHRIQKKAKEISIPTIDRKIHIKDAIGKEKLGVKKALKYPYPVNEAGKQKEKLLKPKILQSGKKYNIENINFKHENEIKPKPIQVDDRKQMPKKTLDRFNKGNVILNRIPLSEAIVEQKFDNKNIKKRKETYNHAEGFHRNSKENSMKFIKYEKEKPIPNLHKPPKEAVKNAYENGIRDVHGSHNDVLKSQNQRRAEAELEKNQNLDYLLHKYIAKKIEPVDKLYTQHLDTKNYLKRGKDSDKNDVYNSVLLQQLTKNQFQNEKNEEFDTILEYLYKATNNTFIQALRENSKLKN